ncbi:hypothetical protein NBRC116493_16380 [Aurantivibrio infirmus]
MKFARAEQVNQKLLCIELKLKMNVFEKFYERIYLFVGQGKNARDYRESAYKIQIKPKTNSMPNVKLSSLLIRLLLLSTIGLYNS